MRAGIVACVGLALVLAGCNPNDRVYFREGIGTQLYTADTASAAELQNIYLDYLCGQANSYVGTDVPSCAQQVIPANYWPIIVQAGLNDVDARCDSYLAWLDQKRRENAAVLAEIGAVRFAVDALTNPNVTGVGAVGLAAISATFGLATDTVKNFNSLLLQVDHTTVQSVVFVNRRDFREKLLNLSINNKPMAIHTLRSYLTICMPMTISANINSSVTVFQQVGPGALDRHSLVSTTTIGRPPTAREQIEPTATTAPKYDPAHEAVIANFNPKVHSIGFVQSILKKLCAPGSEIIQVTTKTNARIMAYQQSLLDSGDASVKVTGKLNSRELGLVGGKQKACETKMFENLYEEVSFPTGIASVATLMNRKLPPNQQLAADASVAQIRAKIPELRKSLNGKLSLRGKNAADPLTVDLSDQLTSDFVKELAK